VSHWWVYAGIAVTIAVAVVAYLWDLPESEPDEHSNTDMTGYDARRYDD
jgi:hypothetical protein